MKKIILLPLFLLLCNFAVSQKIFDDYKTIKNPINDVKIIGKMFKRGIFTGNGTPSFETNIGLSSFQQTDTLKIKAGIDINVSKVVSSKINLTNNKAIASNFDNLKILTCNNYSELPLTQGSNSYVIGAITVGSFDITIDKNFDSGLKAELDKEISKNFNAKPEISYSNNKASVRLGENLVVAIKLLTVTKDKYYVEERKITSSNKIEFYDELTKADDLIKFESVPTLSSDIFTTQEEISKNKGIFSVKLLVSSLNGTENNALNGSLFVAPNCPDEIKGEIQLDCENTYDPNTDFKNISFKRIARGNTSKYIVIYTISLNNLEVTYSRKPKEDKRSNFLIGNVKADVKIRKNVYYYKIEK